MAAEQSEGFFDGLRRDHTCSGGLQALLHVNQDEGLIFDKQDSIVVERSVIAKLRGWPPSFYQACAVTVMSDPQLDGIWGWL